MKVFEVVTPAHLRYKQLKRPASSKWSSMNKSTTDRPQIGGGKFADVFEPENAPGSVEKVAKPHQISSLASDGYYQYLDMLSRNERMTNNPFFPKIHNLKTYRGSDGKYTYKVEIEKLHKLDTLSLEEILMIGRNLFTNFDDVLKHYKDDYMSGYSKKPTGDSVKDKRKIEDYDTRLHQVAIDVLAKMFDKVIDWGTGVSTNIKDSHLKKALMLIRHMVNGEVAATPDVHRENIMVRRGPFTPQIVITDPVS